MAKLTTRELEVVTNSIYKKVDEKKEIFKTTEEYVQLLEKTKIDLKYSEILPLVQEYKAINDEINELTSRKNEITDSIRRIRSGNGVMGIYSEQALDNLISNTVESEINKLYPTKKDIESEIILLSVSGSNDIINSVLTKYNLINNE